MQPPYALYPILPYGVLVLFYRYRFYVFCSEEYSSLIGPISFHIGHSRACSLSTCRRAEHLNVCLCQQLPAYIFSVFHSSSCLNLLKLFKSRVKQVWTTPLLLAITMRWHLDILLNTDLRLFFQMKSTLVAALTGSSANWIFI